MGWSTLLTYELAYSIFRGFKDPPAKAAPIRNEKGVISQSFWYL